MATLGDIAHVANRWYIESGGLVQGSYCGRRLRVAVALQRRSEGEKDVAHELAAAGEQGDEFEVCSHRLGAAGSRALARQLRDDTAIRTLVLRDAALSAAGAGELAEALLENQCLTALTLQLNGIGDAGASALAHGIGAGATSRLCSLALEEEGIGEPGARALAAALSPHGRGSALSSLTTLSLRGNPLQAEGTAALSQALLSNDSLTSLELSSCGLGGLGAARLAEVLPHSHSLKELRLVRNGIPLTGALALAAGLLHNRSLELLHLGANPADTEGWLGFPATPGGRAKVPGLLDAARALPRLRELSLFSNNLGNDGAAAIAGLLGELGCRLQSLDLGDNRIGTVGALALAGVLAKQSTLTTLGLWENHIGSADKPDAEKLAKAIQRNKCLLSVTLHGNPIEARTSPMAMISRALVRNNKHAAAAAEPPAPPAPAPAPLPAELTLPMTLPRVSVGLAGATPREIRTMDADGHTGHTPRPEDRAPSPSNSTSPSSLKGLDAEEEAVTLRAKLVREVSTPRLLTDEHDEHKDEEEEQEEAAAGIGVDEFAAPESESARKGTPPGVKLGLHGPDRTQRPMVVAVVPPLPDRAEASPSSVGLIASAAAGEPKTRGFFPTEHADRSAFVSQRPTGPSACSWTTRASLLSAWCASTSRRKARAQVSGRGRSGLCPRRSGPTRRLSWPASRPGDAGAQRHRRRPCATGCSRSTPPGSGRCCGWRATQQRPIKSCSGRWRRIGPRQRRWRSRRSARSLTRWRRRAATRRWVWWCGASRWRSAAATLQRGLGRQRAG